MNRSASQDAQRPSAEPRSRSKKEELSLPRGETSVEITSWHRWTAVALVALTASLLLWVALGPHKVGDYYTETDFYGGYAEGVRLIQAGHFDPSRYTIVGPVFELVVAVVGLATRELFTAAELVSVAAASGTLALWFWIIARLAGSGLALWTVLFLAFNPTFFRYGYSATTDALGTFMQAAALFFLLWGRRGLVPLLAGMLAALAVLTRYSAIYLLPGALIFYVYFDRVRESSRLRAVALFLVGFAIVVVPWLGVSAQTGQMPGAALFHNIAYDVYAKSKGISWDQYEAQIQPEIHSLQDVVRRDPGLFLQREFTNLVRHLVLDAKLLLGWPVAVWCIFGLVLLLWDRTWRRLLPIWVLGALLFITLVPAIHSARYSLPLAPVYLTLAGAAAVSPRLMPLIKRRRVPVMLILAVLPLCISGITSFSTQRRVLSDLPVEILDASRVLDQIASRGARIMARKAHIAYHAGLTIVPFPGVPTVRTLPELAAYCLREKVEFIYFSQPEADTRPQFTYLLDPQAHVPGLRMERFFPEGPAVLYHIEPGFGAKPAWFLNDSLRTLHVTRALGSIAAAPWRVPLVCGNYAYEERQFLAALKHFNNLTQLRPDFAEGYFLTGQAQGSLGQFDDAASAFSRALALDPDHAGARLGLGLAQLLSGRNRDAAETWRPMIETVTDSTALMGMIELYEKVGDEQSTLKGREVLRRLRQRAASSP